MPSLPASGEVLTPKVMRSTGSSTVRRGSGSGSLGVGDRVADLDLGEAGHDEQVAGHELVDLGCGRCPSKPSSCAGLRLSGPGPRPSSSSRAIGRSAQRAPHDAADGQAAEVVGGVEVGDQRLQRRVGSPTGAGMASRTVSSRAVRSASSAGMPTPTIERPSRAMAEITGNSMWWSGTSRSMNSW